MTVRNRYLLAAYNNEGDHAGYFTERGTLTYQKPRADWFVTEQGALDEINRLKLETAPGWREYTWVPEEVDPSELVVEGKTQDVGGDTPPDHKIDTGVKDEPRPRKPRAQKPVDTKEVQPLQSTTPNTKPTIDTESTELPPPPPPTVDKPTDKETKMPVTKRKTRTTAAKSNAAAPPPAKRRGRPPGSKNKPKPATAKRTATTRRRAPKGTPNRPLVHLCLCGCGKKCGKYFLRGHAARFDGWLQEIAEGLVKPSKYFTPATIKALGPWTNTRWGGVKPKHDYTALRKG